MPRTGPTGRRVWRNYLCSSIVGPSVQAFFGECGCGLGREERKKLDSWCSDCGGELHWVSYEGGVDVRECVDCG